LYHLALARVRTGTADAPLDGKRHEMNHHFRMHDLTDRASHFEFGQNWLSYTKSLNDQQIARAEGSLRRLLQIDLSGRSFLDIGCGSGLFSLAALRLGAQPVRAIDIDENSVASTRQLLAARAPTDRWQVDHLSILEPTALVDTYDIVYSWGVLHHTGSMWSAIELAAKRVAKGGLFAIALYRKTYLCPLWVVEKRLYTRHPRTAAPIANALFKGAWVSAQLLRGRNPLSRIRSYHSVRGMSWSHDVHDWLGGYPYESTTFDEVVAFLRRCGLDLVRSNARRRKEIGLFGSGCDEYVFARP
jgi:2-polyprenyl-6-hydroxyphenyl methylase/3-demethylubiquinone-9 3-methyltransferase